MPDAGEPSAPLLVDVRQVAGQTLDPMRSGVATFDFDILDVEEEQDGAPRRRDSRGRVARQLVKRSIHASHLLSLRSGPWPQPRFE